MNMTPQIYKKNASNNFIYIIKYNIYYFGFIVCEMLNTFMVIVAYGLTHMFLNFRFLGYGFSTWLYYRLPPEEQRRGRTNPMCETFPRIAACDYHRFGTGGKPEKINSLCILALNIINDKVKRDHITYYGWIVTASSPQGPMNKMA